MGDEGGVEGIHVLGRHGGLQYLVGLLRADLGADDAQALADSVDVRIHGHGRHSQGKAQDDSGGLGADAGQLPQPGPRLVHGHLGQEMQVQRAVVQFEDLIENGLDTGRFYLGQTAAGDG